MPLPNPVELPSQNIPDTAQPAARVDEATRPPVRAAGSPEIRTLVRLAVAVAVVSALYLAQDVLLPIVLATMLSFVLSPLVDLIQRGGIPRAPAVIVAVVLAFCVIASAGLVMARQASSLAIHAPQYASAIEQKAQHFQASTVTRLSSIVSGFGHGRGTGTIPAAGSNTQIGGGEGVTGESAGGGTQSAPAAASGPGSVFGIASTILAPVLGPLETTLIVVVIAIFILIEREDLRDRFIRLAGSQDLQRTTFAMDDAARRLSRYFVSQVAVNSTFGAVIGTGLWLIGVPSAGLWGVLAGLLRFIPYLGPILAALPPLAIALAVSPDWKPGVEVASLFVVVEPFTGYAVEPLLYGHSTGLAPISVIIAAVFWTWIWGPIGLIISTPLTLCLVVLGRHVKSLEFLDVLLGDRPALAPADSFYQRMLANDPDGALERAESILASQSMLDYSDSVVLPALQHAAQDEARGAISSDTAAAVSRTTVDVLDELRDVGSGSDGAQEPAGGAAVPTGEVICVSGRGTLDEAVSAMLAQLLQRRGIRARSVPHSSVARERATQADLGGIAAVILSYLDMAGSATHLKYLVRRLRTRAPHVRIIVGLRPAAPNDAAERVRLDAIGADVYVSSLREAVDACLQTTQSR